MALAKEIIAVIIAGLNLLGIVFTITGLAKIKWNYTSQTHHVLFVIILALFIYTLGIAAIFFYIGFKRVLNSSNKSLCLIAAISAIIISLLGFIFSIVCLAVGCSKYDDIEDAYKSIGVDNTPSSGQRATMVCMTVFDMILDFLQIPLWVMIVLDVLKYKGTLNTSNTEVKVNYGQREINLN